VDECKPLASGLGAESITFYDFVVRACQILHATSWDAV